MKIGIVGGGVVGRATARSLIEHVDEVMVWDHLHERSTHPIHDVLRCDLVFVCLPTPMKPQGGCDVSAIDGFFNGLYQDEGTTERQANFVLRSTVPVGTTRRLAQEHGLPNLVHSPEFLTARCSITDAHLPARNVIGMPFPFRGSWLPGEDPKGAGEYFSTDHITGINLAAQALNILYHQRFPGVPTHLMSSDESEAVKLLTNGFFAVKVAYFNEARALADALGLDWDRVLAAVLGDGRIAHSHTRVPGPDGRRGFGGSCLPKDLDNLIRCMQQAGTPFDVCEAAETTNGLVRGETCDAQGAQDQAAGGDAQHPGRVSGQ